MELRLHRPATVPCGAPRTQVRRRAHRARRRLHDVRGEHVAPVGDRRVPDRDLQRRRGEQALADGHLYQVARLQVRRLGRVQHTSIEQSLFQLVRRDPSVELVRQVDPGVGAEAELADVVLQLGAGGEIELLTELVEERVARNGQRQLGVDRPVHARPVVERADRVAVLAPHALGAAVVRDRDQLVGAGVVVGDVRPEQSCREGGIGGERLERRPEVVLALDRAIGEHGAVGVGVLAGREEFLELVAVDGRAEPAVVERRIARHREDLTRVLVHDGHRARWRLVGHSGGRRRINRTPRPVGPFDGRVGGGLGPPAPKLRLQQALGVLLDVEVDRELDVSAVHRGLIADRADDAVVGVDLDHFLAPPAVEHVLHAQLDARPPDILAVDGCVVALVLVALLVLGGDRAHVPDDVARHRGVGIRSPPLRHDRHAGKVLDPFLEGDRDRFLDVCLQRQRPVAAVGVGVVARLHLLDRHLQPSRQSGEHLGPIRVVVDHVPLDGDGEHPRVVGEDPPVGIEDPPPLRDEVDDLRLAGVDRPLQRIGLHGLQEPQPGADGPEQQGRDEGEDAEARGALVSSHGTSLLSSLRGSFPFRALDPHAPPTDGHERRAEKERADGDDGDDGRQSRAEDVLLTDERANDRDCRLTDRGPAR